MIALIARANLIRSLPSSGDEPTSKAASLRTVRLHLLLLASYGLLPQEVLGCL